MENSDLSPVPNAKGSRSRGWLRAGRIAATLFFTYTALTMGFTLVPIESVLRAKIKPLFSTLLTLGGLDQHWNMFGSIPNHRSYEVVVEIEPETGGGWGILDDVGPVLPGNRPVPNYFRYHTFFNRLDEKQYSGGVEPYAEKLGQSILEAYPELEGRRFRIRKTAGRLHPLATIRDLDEASYEQGTIHGPYLLSRKQGGGATGAEP